MSRLAVRLLPALGILYIALGGLILGNDGISLAYLRWHGLLLIFAGGACINYSLNNADYTGWKRGAKAIEDIYKKNKL